MTSTAVARSATKTPRKRRPASGNSTGRTRSGSGVAYPGGTSSRPRKKKKKTPEEREAAERRKRREERRLEQEARRAALNRRILLVGGGIIVFLIFLIIGFLIGRKQADARYANQISAQTASAYTAELDISEQEVIIQAEEKDTITGEM